MTERIDKEVFEAFEGVLTEKEVRKILRSRVQPKTMDFSPTENPQVLKTNGVLERFFKRNKISKNNQSLYCKIVGEYLKRLSEELASRGRTDLGDLQFVIRKAKAKSPKYCFIEGERTLMNNIHSDGYYAKTRWIKTKIYLETKWLYSFNPAKYLRSLISKQMIEDHRNYLEL